MCQKNRSLDRMHSSPNARNDAAKAPKGAPAMRAAMAHNKPFALFLH
jgi:hypothetical protein